MSDHETVTFSIDCKRPLINKRAPRRVYFYHKGDISGLKSELQEFQEHFCASDPLQNLVEKNWQLLKDAIQKSIIPSKLTKSRDKLPRINSSIKQKMKQRKRLYDKAKRTGNYTDWCDYKQARNEVNSLLETAHYNYRTNLFNDSSTSKKRFWSYIKAKKKDNTGVAPLKNGQTVCTNAKQKACILYNQFQSVFTTEDLLNTPLLDYSIHPSMEDLSFTTHGIQLLLEKLDPAKAPGPDHIPTKAIKLCANVIAPVLQIIYSQSLEHAILPQDWLSANITPVFKREIGVFLLIIDRYH